MPTSEELFKALDERRKNCTHPPDKIVTYSGIKACKNCGVVLQ